MKKHCAQRYSKQQKKITGQTTLKNTPQDEVIHSSLQNREFKHNVCPHTHSISFAFYNLRTVLAFF